MGKKLYVGNLAYGVTDGDLQQMFGAYGAVQSAQVIMDRDTGRSKGFGFVEMGSDAEAQAAIAALNGTESGGRNLTVNEAKPREDRGRGGPGGGRGGYGGGGGRGYGDRRYYPEVPRDIPSNGSGIAQEGLGVAGALVVSPRHAEEQEGAGRQVSLLSWQAHRHLR